MSVALYCKSFSNDLWRLKSLLDSISRHNRDRLNVYVSVPVSDFQKSQALLEKASVSLFSDEEILGKNLPDSQITQQIVKLSFWKAVPEEVILMLDSDSYFIKDFYERTFVDSSGVPYTVMHQQKDYFQFTARICAINKVNTAYAKRGFIRNRRAIRRAIGATIDAHTVLHDFGPSPYIWSRKVLESFQDEFLVPKKMTLNDCMSISPSELSWYGEWLLHRKPIEIIPIEPLFKVFHVRQQYEESLRLQETELSLKENFYGIVLQSNWNAPLRFGEPLTDETR